MDLSVWSLRARTQKWLAHLKPFCNSIEEMKFMILCCFGKTPTSSQNGVYFWSYGIKESFATTVLATDLKLSRPMSRWEELTFSKNRLPNPPLRDEQSLSNHLVFCHCLSSGSLDDRKWGKKWPNGLYKGQKCCIHCFSVLFWENTWKGSLCEIDRNCQ